MRLKLFRAATTADAMAQVRNELGPDALILGSRRVADGVEITAALETVAAPAPPSPVPPPPPPPDPARVAMLSHHRVPTALRAALEQGNLDTALSLSLAFGALPLAVGGRPLLLTGPPGAGKTLTAARLATRLVMSGVPPMVITADGKRAGATEQLAAFTRLLGVILIVANHPVTLARAITRREGGAPIVIDAPGIDPFDPIQAEELRGMAAAVDAEIALVLPAGLDPAEAADLAIAFGEIGAGHLVVTRLDIARRLGGLLAAADASRLPLTEAGIGPGAADGLERLTPAVLADRLIQTGKPHHEPHAA